MWGVVLEWSAPMAAFRRSFTRAGNRFGVWLYRTLDGRLSSGRRGVTVLLITSPGRRTGRARSTCVRYLDTPDGFLVWGTGAGSRRDPGWFENLRATPTADVQIRSRHLAVQARELTGPERDETWRDVVLAAAPEVARYARKAGRTIPVAVLRPLENADPAIRVDSA
jgi:deazaflavin-dependent oxidoreductase (nitroreductase family)